MRCRIPVAAGDPREIEAAPASEDFVKGGGRPWRVEARKSLPRQGPERREQTRTGPWSTDAWRYPGGAEVGWVSKDEQDRRAGVPLPRARKQTRLPSLQRAGADGHAWAGGPGDRGCGLQTRSPARKRSSAPCSGPSASARSSRQPRVRVGTWLPRGRGHPQEPLPGAAGQGSAVGRDTGLFRPRPLPSSAGNGPACHGGGVSRRGPPSSAGPRSGSPVPLAHPHSPLVCVCVCVPGGRGGGDEACALPVGEEGRAGAHVHQHAQRPLHSHGSVHSGRQGRQLLRVPVEAVDPGRKEGDAVRPVSAASGTGSPRLPLSRVLGREAAAVPDPDSAPPRGMCLFPARPSCQRGRLAGHGGPRPLCARQGLGSGPGRGAPGSPAELSSSGLWRRLRLSAPQQKVAGGPWASPRCRVDASDVRFPRRQCLGEPRRAVGKTQVTLVKGLEILEVSRQGVTTTQDRWGWAAPGGRPLRAEIRASRLGSRSSPRLNVGTLREPWWARGVPGGPRGPAERDDPVRGSGGHSPVCAPGRRLPRACISRLAWCHLVPPGL